MTSFRGLSSNSQAIIDKANSLWDNILDKDDRTSPEDSDMVLVTKDEFFDALQEMLDTQYGCALCVGNGLSVYGDYDSISRAQQYVLLDTTHPIEKEDVKRIFARSLQAIERAQGAPVGTLHQVKKAG